MELQDKIQKALDLGGNTHSLKDVAESLQAGRARLWHKGESVVITEITDYPEKRVLSFWLAAGNLEEILDLAKSIYEYAREMDCDGMVFTGRKGWQKPLADHGWVPAAVEYHKEVSHGQK